MALISIAQLEDLQEEKAEQLKTFLSAEPPDTNGDKLLKLWNEVYDKKMKSIVLETKNGPSDDATNPVRPYEKIQALVKDGGNWKWPRMWQRLDEVERRGPAYTEGEAYNFGMPNKAPNAVKQRICLVGGGPVGLRLGIELVMAGHEVVQFEKRREIRTGDGPDDLKQLGFTNRINRPHMWPFVRNDLGKLNGKDFLSRQAAYPVFTEPDTSSIGIDELQVLLLKNSLMLGVDFRLGVGYEDAKVVVDEKTQKPRWKVKVSVDAEAAEQFDMEEGTSHMVFDVLIGADGPRSQVRATQGKHFGNIEKRKFMDCIGIVANVRKVSRKRLKDLGFEYGQEPNDMNRSGIVFRDFFAKIRQEANAELETIIYYKASFHNYTIITPKKDNLKEHGLGGPVYHFHNARANPKMQEEKALLKTYCAKVLTAAGIPVDVDLPNGGFVNAPNDVMAFDFAECWNTPKSMTFNLPPPDYDVDVHGEWMGRRLIPMVALVGDALLEPFWPLGLGLKRGWQAVMDTCYAVDTLYNTEAFRVRKGKSPEEWTWDDHHEALAEQVAQNFELCNRLKVCEELGKGAYEEKGPVMTQLKRFNKDAEIPIMEVEVDPWTRYDTLAKEAGDDWKLKMKDPNWVHPRVQKELNKTDYYTKNGMSKTGEFKYKGMELLKIVGKTPAGKGGAGGAGAPKAGGAMPTIQRRPSIIKDPPKGGLGGLVAANPGAVTKRAEETTAKLHAAVLEAQVDKVVENRGKEATVSKTISRRKSTIEDQKNLAAILSKAPVGAYEGKSDAGVTENAESAWNRMSGKGMSPAQDAELKHVRNMIDSLTKSLEQYKQAERELMSGK